MPVATSLSGAADAPAEEFPSRILLGQSRILSLLANGTHIDQVLTEFCHLLDYSVPGVHCCVMLHQTAGSVLQVAAAPSLPVDFRDAMEGVAVGAANGSCAAAVHRNETVISSDVRKDPVWHEIRSRISQSGLRASWSAPIHGVRWAAGEGERDEVLVLGTVAFYFDEPRPATPRDVKILQMAASLASLAISTSRTQERIGREQLYDTVTGLPDRKVFSDQLKEALASLTPHEDQLAVLLLDLDHFKEINDTFGYAVGDFLLKRVGERLVNFRHGTDLLARFGDDEFGIMISNLASHDEVKQFAKEVLAAVAEPYDSGGQQLGITASLGASLYPWDGEDAQTLMRNAENALYAAKRQGRNRFRLYAPTMGGFAFEKLQLKMALGYAVENRELGLHFQPKVRSSDQVITGSEALVYWNHPSKGKVPPAEFIPIAEESGLIIAIGDWVLREACTQVQSWRRQGHELNVAVNISAYQFRERGFVDKVAMTLERTGLHPAALELEITETVAMTEVEQTMERMKGLQKLGVTIAIDDFGTGYSSLEYLKRFPIRTLKIDKSFVLKLHEDKEDMAIVEAVIALARALGLEIVAEGVETEEQAEFLRGNGCHYLQGYHFSRPVAAPEFEDLLAKAAG